MIVETLLFNRFEIKNTLCLEPEGYVILVEEAL